MTADEVRALALAILQGRVSVQPEFPGNNAMRYTGGEPWPLAYRIVVDPPAPVDDRP